MSKEEVIRRLGIPTAEEVQEQREEELQLVLRNMNQGIPLEDTSAALRFEARAGSQWRKDLGEVFPEVRQPTAKERMIGELMLMIRRHFTATLSIEQFKREVIAIAGPSEITWTGSTILVRRLQEEADGTHIEINIDF